MNDADKIIAERERTHGDYDATASCSQQLKYVFHTQAGWAKLSSSQRESMEQIATKLARALNGDPNLEEHWDDIAGYATLVSGRLESSRASDERAFYEHEERLKRDAVAQELQEGIEALSRAPEGFMRPDAKPVATGDKE